MKITIALLFLGLLVLAVAEPDLEENPQQDEDDQDDNLIQDDKDDLENAVNDGEDFQDKRRYVSRRYRTFRLCEHKSGTLRCPRGQKLIIHNANYGRTTGRHVCPHPSIRTTNCRSYKSNISIRSKCHKKNSCRLYASNRVYGDPCVGTFKYIEVKYSCARYICYWKYY